MKKIFIALSLIACCPLFAAAPENLSVKAPSETTELDLQMALPGKNGTFLHLMHNLSGQAICHTRFDAFGLGRTPEVIPYDRIHINRDITQFPLTLRGMAYLSDGGLLTMITQRFKTSDKLIINKKISPDPYGTTKPIATQGKIHSIEVAEIPACHIAITLLIEQLDKPAFYQHRCLMSQSLDRLLEEKVINAFPRGATHNSGE